MKKAVSAGAGRPRPSTWGGMHHPLCYFRIAQVLAERKSASPAVLSPAEKAQYFAVHHVVGS